MSLSYKFFLRPGSDTGKQKLYLQFILQRKRSAISTGIDVCPSDWNENKQLVKNSDPEANYKNMVIQEFITKIHQVEIDCFMNNKQITLMALNDKFSNKYVNIGIVKYIDKIIKEKRFKLTPGTLKFYFGQKSKLSGFSKNATICDVDINFIIHYEKYLMESRLNNGNTISKAHSFLKTILNHAITDNIIKENPYRRYKIKAIKGNRSFLTSKELTILTEYYEKESDYFRKCTLKCFLFACYTGLRYSDIKNFRRLNIQDNMISIKMSKTGETVRIPIIMQARNLLNSNRLLLEDAPVFKVFTNQAINRELKLFAAQAKINKTITFHVARHTFATMAISSGIPIEVVSKLLGHNDIKTTQIYAKIVDEKKIREMNKLETYMKQA